MIKKADILLQKLIEEFGPEEGPRIWATLLIDNKDDSGKIISKEDKKNCLGFCDICSKLQKFTDLQGMDSFYDCPPTSDIFTSLRGGLKLEETDDGYKIVETPGETWCLCQECQKHSHIFREVGFNFKTKTYEEFITYIFTDSLLRGSPNIEEVVEYYDLFDNFHHLARKHISGQFPDLVCPETGLIRTTQYFELCNAREDLPDESEMTFGEFFKESMLNFSSVLSEVFTSVPEGEQPDPLVLKQKIIEACQEVSTVSTVSTVSEQEAASPPSPPDE